MAGLWFLAWFMQLLAFVAAFFFNAEVRDLKQQAFQRGYMVECVGKSGYYWECEK